MVCVSIQGKTRDEIYDILDRADVEMAEIRLDLCPLDDDDIEDLFGNSDTPLVATCRAGVEYTQAEAEHRLTLAIDAGAKYVDLEIEAPAAVGKRIKKAANEAGTILIRSYHNYECTPSIEEMEDMAEKCIKFGAEVVKLAVMAQSAEDVERVESMYECLEPGQLLAFCMGEAGRQSRVDALKLGAPFSFAALDASESVAPGQWPLEEMNKAVYGDAESPFTGRNEDVLRIPASKSFAQRAIVAAALAEGTSHLYGYSPCADSEAAIAVARSLGATVVEGETLEITGIGPIGESLKMDELFTGESGLLTRLMIPVMSQICEAPVAIKGHGTLLKRPLSGANDIMAAFGVVLSSLEHASKKDVFVPLSIGGKLMPGRADISGKGGSQLISGLLMALPLAAKPSTIYVSDPKSIPYMFITLDVLRKFGINVVNEMEGDEEFLETQDWSLCTGMTFRIKGRQHYKAADFDIEGDWSGAANFMVAGAIFGGAHLDGLDEQSLQADLTIMDILVNAGASVSKDDDGVMNVQKAPLIAIEEDLNNAPDLFPIVAVLAAFCAGTSRIAGVGRLANKESDRGQALLQMLTQMGVPASIEGDEMVIEGQSLTSRRLSGNLLHGGSYTSHHDHRMVMALSVASLGADAPIEIDDTDCVSKSYPGFLEAFEEWVEG